MSENFRLKLTLQAPVERLYQALASKDGPAAWWTVFCDTSDEVGGISKFRFPKAGFYAHMRITDLRPHELVEWECVDSRHPKDAPFSDLRDWVGTRIRFQCRPVDDATCELAMEHVGLTPQLECYDTCHSGWSHYLGQSLRGYLETGTGQPYTDDSVDNL